MLPAGCNFRNQVSPFMTQPTASQRLPAASIPLGQSLFPDHESADPDLIHLVTHKFQLNVPTGSSIEIFIAIIKKSGKKEEILQSAVIRNHLTAIHFLVEKCGADINHPHHGEDKSVPLHCAAMMGKVQTVKILAMLKAELNIQDNEGRTPLHFAVHARRLGVIKVLVADYGADLNIGDHEGCTPLHCAAKQGWEEAVRIFIEHGAKLDMRDVQGATAFDYATEANDESLKDLLRGDAVQETP